jgi:hypothetical protein
MTILYCKKIAETVVCLCFVLFCFVHKFPKTDMSLGNFDGWYTYNNYKKTLLENISITATFVFHSLVLISGSQHAPEIPGEMFLFLLWNKFHEHLSWDQTNELI